MVHVNDLHKHFKLPGTKVSIFDFSNKNIEDLPERNLKAQLQWYLT